MGSFPETYSDPKNAYNYPASRGYSLAWLLALTKPFALLVCRVVRFLQQRSDSINREAMQSKCVDFYEKLCFFELERTMLLTVSIVSPSLTSLLKYIF